MIVERGKEEKRRQQEEGSSKGGSPLFNSFSNMAFLRLMRTSCCSAAAAQDLLFPFLFSLQRLGERKECRRRGKEGDRMFDQIISSSLSNARAIIKAFPGS